MAATGCEYITHVKTVTLLLHHFFNYPRNLNAVLGITLVVPQFCLPVLPKLSQIRRFALRRLEREKSRVSSDSCWLVIIVAILISTSMQFVDLSERFQMIH